jgi:hypothetical protein
MDTEKKSESGKNSASKNETPGMEFKAKWGLFLKKNHISVILFVALILSSIWFTVKINNNSNHFENVKTQLILKYETELDSLQIQHLGFASTVFSWSIRSEILRNNMENLNQLLTVFVKESKADLVQIVNPETRVVMLSSDKKYEGTEFLKNINFELNEPVVIRDDQKISIITPIMGFSSRIGVLIVEMR